MKALQAPFPWFGGKSRVADIVWKRFGDVSNYVEPFFGSGAVLLGRPHTPRIETVNDLDGFVANFWRAVANDPEEVAHHCDWPANENDLHARHAWLVTQRQDLTRRLEGDPDFFDAKIAGWWCWGICCWIGGGWCSGKGPWSVEDGKLVFLGGRDQGVKRVRPQLCRFHGANKISKRSQLVDWMRSLQERLRHVRVCCGDWSRVCGPSPTVHVGHPTAVFLDPPYDDTRDTALYAKDSTTLMGEVASWCHERGGDTRLRIALCGYEGSFDPPEGWTGVSWKAWGGYSNLGNAQGKANVNRERIWFSPGCLDQEEPFWFDDFESWG